MGLLSVFFVMVVVGVVIFLIFGGFNAISKRQSVSETLKPKPTLLETQTVDREGITPAVPPNRRTTGPITAAKPKLESRFKNVPRSLGGSGSKDSGIDFSEDFNFGPGNDPCAGKSIFEKALGLC